MPPIQTKPGAATRAQKQSKPAPTPKIVNCRIASSRISPPASSRPTRFSTSTTDFSTTESCCDLATSGSPSQAMDNKRKASASRGGAVADGDHPPAKRRKMPSVSPTPVVCPRCTHSCFPNVAMRCVALHLLSSPRARVLCRRALSGEKMDAVPCSEVQRRKLRAGLGWLLALPLVHRDRSSIRA